MNFIFISPNFPESYWLFCQGLKNLGVNVLAIADAVERHFLHALQLQINLTNKKTISKGTAN